MQTDNIKPQNIRALIENGLTDCKTFIEGSDGKHFTAIVISPAFIDKNRVQKQQLVYATLGNRIENGTIHAISIKTFTPEEWDNHNKKGP